MAENGKWNRPTSGNPTAERKRGKPTATRGLVAGLLVVVVAGIAAWLIMSPAESRKPEPRSKKPTPIKDVKPAAVPKPMVAETNKVAKTESAVPLEKWNGHEIVSRKTVTNGVNVVITMVGKDGKIYKELKKTTKPIFTNPVDQVLSMLLSNPPGASIAPLPSLGSDPDELFAKALRSPIVINDDDPENVKKAKLLVQGAREQILEEMGKGRSVMDVISSHISTVNDNNKLHGEVRETYEKMVQEGDLEVAEQYRTKANQILLNAGAEIVPEHGTSRRSRKEPEK